MEPNLTTTTHNSTWLYRATVTSSSHGRGELQRMLDPVSIAYYVFLGLVCALGSVGNVMTMLAVKIERRLREAVSSYFVVNLAIADFVVCAVVVPMLLFHHIAAADWQLNVLCYVTAAVSGVACHCAAITMTFIALNRFLAARMSNNYLNYVTKRRVLIAIACGWLFAAINTAPIVLAWLEVEYDATRFVCVCFDGTFPLHYTLGPVFIGHFLPHAVTVTCYVIILRAVGRSRNRIQNSKTFNTNQSSVAFASDAENKGVRNVTIDIPSNSMAHGERADSSRKETGGGGGLSVKHWSKHEMQMFRTSVWIIAFFSFCWIPYGILVLLQHLAPIALKKTFASLCLLSFSLNPLIYGVLSKSFRRAYARMLRKVFFCSPRHVTSHATSSSHRLSAIPQHARHA